MSVLVRLLTPYRRRPSLLWGLLFAALALAGATGISLAILRDRADQTRLGQALLSDLRSSAHELRVLESRAIAGREGVSALVDKAESVSTQASRALHELEDIGGKSGALGPVVGAYPTYQSAVMEELSLLEAGRAAEAERLELERVDPAFGALQRAIVAASERYGSTAKDTIRATDLGSAVALLVAVVGLVLLLRNFAAERGREELSREIESRSRSLVEELPLVTYVDRIDEHRSSIYISPQIGKYLGYTQTEWLEDQRLFKKVLHRDDWARVLEEHAEWFRRGGSYHSEYRLVAKDGRVVWFADEGVVELDEHGAPLHARGFLVDVTERKRAQEALRDSEEHLRQAQKMEAIGRLAGGVAHDFNNLLTAISGHADLLLESTSESSPLREDVEQIRKAAARAAALTRQLLAFSRKQVLQAKVLDLNAVIGDIEKMLRRLIGEHIELVTHLEPNLGNVRADPGQVQQVLLNLVVNASDAMPTGGRLAVETSEIEVGTSKGQSGFEVSPGPYVLLRVSDTGVGMSPEILARVFEPFFTTKEQGKGTGLGLSTVLGIVKQSGGDVSVTSRIGEGTAFEIVLPRVDGEVEPLAAPGGNAASVPGGPETILLVENEAPVRKLARRALEARGYRVVEAENGLDALDVYARHAAPVDLLVTDVVMPGLSGPELAVRLEVAQPEMRIVYMSGYAADSIARHGPLREGAVFVQKPFTAETLTRAIVEALRSARPEARRDASAA